MEQERRPFKNHYKQEYIRIEDAAVGGLTEEEVEVILPKIQKM